MFRGSLALLKRSLRVNSRAIIPHLLHAGLLTLSLMLMVALNWETKIEAPGRALFLQMAWLNFAFIILAGCGLFASTVTEEKEEETLDLLQMAGINPLTLLLGKAVPRLVGCLLMLAVQIPFVILSVTMGGVAPRQIAGVYVALAAFLIFVAGIATLASVVFKTTAKAAISTLIFIFCVLAIPGIGLDFLDSANLGRKGWVARSFEYIYKNSVTTRLAEVMQIRFNGSPVCEHTVIDVVGGVTMFVIAWITFYWWMKRPGKSRRTVSSASTEHQPLNIRPKHGRSWSLALAWKDYHFSAGGIRGTFLRIVIYPILIFAWMLWMRFDSLDSAKSIGTNFQVFSVVFAVLEMTYASGRIFRNEIRNQTLTGIMILPRESVIQVVAPKMAGYAVAMFPALLCMIVGIVLNPQSFGDFLEALEQEGTLLIMGTVFMLVLVFLHVSAFLSLFVKWGAIPLALGVMLCVLILVSLIALATHAAGQGFIVFFDMVGLFTVITLQFAIGEKLRELAAR